VIRLALCVCLVITLADVGWAQSDSSKAESKAGRKANPSSPRPTPSKQRTRRLNKRQVKQSLAFARAHHPELAKLVSRLKGAGNRSAYDKAVLELFRTAERLERAKAANPKRYEMLLELWKLESQARLMVAQQTMKPDPDRAARLKQTLRKRAELRREMLSADIKRSRERIDRIEIQLKALENLDAAADRELRRLKRSAKMTADRSKSRRAKSARKAVSARTGRRTGKQGKQTVKKTVGTKDKSKP